MYHKLIAKALNILGTATQDYPKRTNTMHFISLAYWLVQALEHLKASIIRVDVLE